jgi:hypothetical protein
MENALPNLTDHSEETCDSKTAVLPMITILINKLHRIHHTFAAVLIVPLFKPISDSTLSS